MPEEILSHTFQLHYYFDDESHSMNAFVRNRAEKDFLEAVKRILEITEIHSEIETEAYNQGGLVENLNLIVPALSAVAVFLSPAINEILKYHFTKSKTDDAIKAETLKGLQLDNASKMLEYEIKLKKALEDKVVRKHVSNFYTRLSNYEKVVNVGFANLNVNLLEEIIPRVKFKEFILVDAKTVVEDDDAEMEIISPVLQEGALSWRGKYKNEKIDFSMGDSKFKSEVIGGEHQFANGFVMSCLLKMTIIFDEFGDEKRRAYAVKKVYAIKESKADKYKLRAIGYKKKMNKDQGMLFDDGVNGND